MNYKKLKSIMKFNDHKKFNTFLFISTFARSLIEIFISLYLFKNGFSLQFVLAFYLLENVFSIFASYLFVQIGERINYSIVMYIGVTAFIMLQFVLGNLVHNFSYIILISILYAIYRRGYWVARRFYVTTIMPQRESSIPYSIIMVVSEIASILSGFLGSFLLDSFNVVALTILSSILLFISALPLIKIDNKGQKTKIELIKNLKKYDKRNYLAFSLYEINNLLAFIFPIFIFLYIEETYAMTGIVNAISSLAIIVFIILYGRLIRKKNYFILSSVLFLFICIAKLFLLNYFILALCFIEGLIKKMQSQSLNKIYFENRNGMDLAHYNLIYQIVEAVARATVTIPLLFMNDIRIMILFVLLIIGIELVFYASFKKTKKLN
ncbi:MFS transporter [Candidatus Saccharibacteria bacterium]|nr:MFS transporter [Candidatus Saccharibacteria bacterium]